MGEVRYVEEIHVEAPVEAVYAYRLDLRHLADYNPNVSNLSPTDPGDESGEGSVYTFDVAIEGIGTVPTTLRIVAADPPARIENEMSAGLVAREVCTFAPRGEGTHVAFEVAVEVPDDLDGPGRAFIEASGRAQVRLELEGIKRALEGSGGGRRG